MRHFRTVLPLRGVLFILIFAMAMNLLCRSLSVEAPVAQYASRHPELLSVTLATDSAKYKLGSDILVKIEETNRSGDLLHILMNGASIDYDVCIRHGSTTLEPLPPGLRSGPRGVISGRPIPPALQPNQTRIEPGSRGNWSPISDWGPKIDEPGTYVITAVSRETKQKSNPVTITVTQ